MYIINASDVSGAWYEAAKLIETAGVRRPSRVGDVLVVPSPVVTIYNSPWQRVLLDPVRDCNPFFHLAEALWMLQGRDDAIWLDQFVSDFSSRFAEQNGRMHGAYGRRWRRWGERSASEDIDQLDEVVRLLKNNKNDRQAVIQMWDPVADLGVTGLKDRPCNTSILLRADNDKLDMTVTCRSNDVVFGCYGANAVHMSILQEYLAAKIGIDVGIYVQFSNNWHMYESSASKVSVASAEECMRRPYPGFLPLVSDPHTFDADLDELMSDPMNFKRARNRFLRSTVRPMLLCNAERRAGFWEVARGHAEDVEAPDWRAAALEWIDRHQR